MMFNYKVFSIQLHTNQMIGLLEFRTIVRVEPRRICGPCLKILFMCVRQLIGSSYMLITTILMEHLSLHDVWDCFLFGLGSKFSAVALLLMHRDYLQSGLYFEIKLLDRIWFGKI